MQFLDKCEIDTLYQQNKASLVTALYSRGISISKLNFKTIKENNVAYSR